jgi:hypothetical protein
MTRNCRLAAKGFQHDQNKFLLQSNLIIQDVKITAKESRLEQNSLFTFVICTDLELKRQQKISRPLILKSRLKISRLMRFDRTSTLAPKPQLSTVDSPQIGHPHIGQVLELTGFCGDGRAATPLHAVLIQDKSSKRRVCLDPEHVRFQDC